MSDWQPRYLVQKAPGVDGDPIPEGEPVLVIRAQDVLAPLMLAHYISTYSDSKTSDPAVIHDLCRHWEALIAWRKINQDKIKVADR